MGHLKEELKVPDEPTVDISKTLTGISEQEVHGTKKIKIPQISKNGTVGKSVVDLVPFERDFTKNT